MKSIIISMLVLGISSALLGQDVTGRYTTDRFCEIEVVEISAKQVCFPSAKGKKCFPYKATKELIKVEHPKRKDIAFTVVGEKTIRGNFQGNFCEYTKE